MIDQFVILRSRDQGVVCGYLKSLVTAPAGMGVATLEDARQIHQWQQENKYYTLFEVSQHGCNVARISEASPTFIMFGVCGVYLCTPEAEKNLKQSRWNSAPKSSGSSRRAKKQPG